MTTVSGSVKEFYDNCYGEIKKVISGQEEVIKLIFTGLLSSGHLLIEGVPGTAKTLIVKTIAYLLKGDFKRIQFTPDMMPSDVIGTSIFDLKTTSFNLKKGPIFTNFLLADEINRTPPKTQSALLEAMEEEQVSIEGASYPLPSCFTVFATQNPIEFEGTYPLPEAQLDRFMMKIIIDYPKEEEEKEILKKYDQGLEIRRLGQMDLQAQGDFSLLENHRLQVKKVVVEEGIIGYIMEITKKTRQNPYILLGTSPRGAINLLLAAKSLAALEGKDFVTPSEVKTLAYPVLRHRLILNPEAEIEGLTTEDIIKNILSTTKVPR